MKEIERQKAVDEMHRRHMDSIAMERQLIGRTVDAEPAGCLLIAELNDGRRAHVRVSAKIEGSPAEVGRERDIENLLGVRLAKDIGGTLNGVRWLGLHLSDSK